MILGGVLDRPWAVVALLALALAEYGWRAHRVRKGYDLRAAFASVGVMLGGAPGKPVGGLVIGAAFGTCG